MYAARWDGRDDGGREVASGTYQYRLTAGEQVGFVADLINASAIIYFRLSAWILLLHLSRICRSQAASWG